MSTTYREQLDEFEWNFDYMLDTLNEIEKKIQAIDALHHDVGGLLNLDDLKDFFLDMWDAFDKFKEKAEDINHKITYSGDYLAKELFSEQEYQEWQKEVA